jgi:hypothetical protein
LLTVEATQAKREEIASAIRADAGSLSNPANPNEEMLRLMESLVYAEDAAALARAKELAAAYVSGLKQAAPDQLSRQKDQAVGLWNTMNWLKRFKIIPAEFAPAAELDSVVKAQGWDKKKKK